MRIKFTLSWKKFYIGSMMRMQQAIDAMNSSHKDQVVGRKAVLDKINVLAKWLERPFNDMQGIDYDYDGVEVIQNE